MKCDLSLIAIVRVLLKNIHEKKGVVAKLLDTLSKIIRLLLKMKELLSHILTKEDLTIHLAEDCVDRLSKVGKQSVVVFDPKCITNIPQYPEKLLQHNQEEADTLILLQSKNVTDLDPFTDLYVVSPDTDILLLLIYYYPQLCASTTFRTGIGNDQSNIEIRKMYESIGPLYANAILGFLVFTGFDQIGRFYGKSKLECFRIFTDCQREKLDDFIALGSTESIDSLDNFIEILQEFVLDLYCRHRPDTVKDIATLRYYLFSKY